MKRSSASENAPRTRRGFTLVELVLAVTIAGLVLVTVVVTLSQIGRAREITRGRLLAHLRADSALEEIRRDLASVLRDSDLFRTRVLLFDGSTTLATRDGRTEVGRDEVLVFNSRLEPLGSIDYNGEGGEYETQYRIDEDRFGAALWQRRDAVPDDWPDGGGVATPIAEGVVGIDIMAYDGQDWFEDWDSDIDGLPWAFRITITTVGSNNGDVEDLDPRSLVVLRSHVALDRIVPPYVEPPEEEEEEGQLDGELADESGDIGGGGFAGGAPGEQNNGGGRGARGRGGRGGGEGGRGGDGGGRGGGAGGGGGRPGGGFGGGGGRPGGGGGGPFRPATGGGGSAGSKPGGNSGNTLDS